jgi:hypothetical protein
VNGEYPEAMTREALEDERGVDLWAIRERLRMTPAARVDRLMEEIQAWSEIVAFVDHSAE